ncbi:serine/threonine protein kinase [Geomonas sp. RF6]|uniref:serine/threonine protein kinase n=1 Tax=Geomonas sp. RF6 TaxID=2897342 RepID=UPI001E54A48F|nr:serine/threonine-protein kinase [Geomonas sp. RF6]UFS71187.1 serine/threonine protein kinase [Geomonas sp. RF6]
MIDREIGSYWVVKKISDGREGAVYAGVHKTKDQEVVIREIPFSVIPDPAARARFLRDASFLKKAAPSHMVKIELCEESDGFLYLVTEHLPETLEDLLERECLLPTATALALCLRLLDALQYLHRYQIVHGRISPRNVYLTSEGRAKLAYIGATAIDDPQLKSYLPPEDPDGVSQGAAADLYGIGAVLCKMVGKEPPYTADPSAPLIEAEAEAAVPPELRDLLAKAMARDPAERFRSAQEFARAVRQKAEGTGGVRPAKVSRARSFLERTEGFGVLLVVMVVLLFFVVVGRHRETLIQGGKVHVVPVPKVASEIPSAPKIPPPATALPVVDQPTPAAPAPETTPQPAAEKRKKATQVHHKKKRVKTVSSSRRSETASLPVAPPPPDELDAWSIRK